jgi:hypothetical protein
MGMKLDNSLDTNKPLAPEDSCGVEGDFQESSRRRFTRHSIVGSAVFLSLGNRAAWSKDNRDACMSTMLMESYLNFPAAFASSHPDLVDQAENIVNLANNPMYRINRNRREICVVRKNQQAPLLENSLPSAARDLEGAPSDFGSRVNRAPLDESLIDSSSRNR